MPLLPHMQPQVPMLLSWQSGFAAGAGMARSKEWWRTLLGMLMHQRLVRSEARQGGLGSFSAVALTPEARPCLCF